ncbi:DUF3592 domain-containing protein [Sphingomonas turrisvirgatae]|uniref:DUF3592 domain-containing protein n=1 Tax=Sphingomonas turrisvirgatae TaxID=1888892 RepID=A0A1E3M1A0_9SPHN|nr:DUF3592 domain-containing protein [Sphingomonas turrisvirgatae]ODP38840.1 hypothetical protein BFL28_12970 [Sphingomonas turrisvirgatae]
MDVFTAVSLGLILLGIPIAWFGIHRYRKQGRRFASARAHWKRTDAEVIDAQLVDRESTDSDGDSTTWYEPKLRYRYAVAGQVFEGDRTALCTALRFSLFPPAQQWLLAHPPGTVIDLWYDPAQPQDSAPLLDKPSLFAAAALVIVGGGFAGLGAALLAGFA